MTRLFAWPWRPVVWFERDVEHIRWFGWVELERPAYTDVVHYDTRRYQK